MRTCFLSILFAVVGLLAGCSTPTGHVSASSSDSDAFAALRKELQQTQAQLEQAITRTSALEQQVRALEQSNAELQREVRRLQVPREPRWGRPQTNQVPHLTPLQTQ
jgi:septal ring factor EnvC (AmiA/AmiB activator)